MKFARESWTSLIAHSGLNGPKTRPLFPRHFEKNRKVAVRVKFGGEHDSGVNFIFSPFNDPENGDF